MERLQRILDESLLAQWPLEDDLVYVVDVGVECLGTDDIAKKPTRGKRDSDSLLYRSLIVQSARWPAWTESALVNDLAGVVRRIGYGVPDLERATANSPWRTTLIASRDGDTGRELRIKARECHVFEVPIPESMRRQGDEFDIRIEVTLSYAAQPRRTRRNNCRYLSIWLTWTSSKLGEAVESFRGRALKDQDDAGDEAKGTKIPWSRHVTVTCGRTLDVLFDLSRDWKADWPLKFLGVCRRRYGPTKCNR